MKIWSMKKDKVKTFNELCGNNAENIKKPPKNYTTKATDNIKDIKRCEKIPNWHNSKKEQPKVDGEYICTCKNAYTTFITMCSYATNYYAIDLTKLERNKIEYIKKRKDKSGWYGYDREKGYYKIPKKNILAWMELPKPYKEKL